MKKTPNKQNRETKICPSCARPFQNRKRWSDRGIWDQVIYCSEQCRKKKRS